MLSIPGTEALSPAVKYLIAFAIIFVLLALFALVLRRLTGGRLSMPTGDRRSRQPRLGIVDVYDLDRQRQLILLRRDNVEHLLLIGGPNDVVVETNIVRTPGARLPASPIEQTDRPEAIIDRSFEAQPRPFVEPMQRSEPVVARLGPAEAGRAEHPVHPAAISEPILKPDVVTLSPAPAPSPRPVPQPVREAAPPPAVREPHVPMREPPPQSYREPAPLQPVREAPPPPVQRTVPAKAPPPPREAMSPLEHPAMRAPEQPSRQAAQSASSSRQPDQTVADAAVLSNMAKQLEEALKRPLSPAKAASNLPPVPNGPVQHGEDRPSRSIPNRAPQPVPAPAPAAIPMASASSAARYSEPQEQPRPRPAAASVSRMRPTPEPEPVNTRSPPPPPPQPAPSGRGETSDPFSVEEIEAEFARLLGRPLDPGERPH